MRTVLIDFESTSEENYRIDGCVRPWLWHARDVMTLEDLALGTDLDTLISFTRTFSEVVIYTHNLKFDLSFILDYILHKGYKCVPEVHDKCQFSAIISDMGQFYKAEVMWDDGSKTEYRDSLKKIPMSAADMARSYKLTTLKGEIDYTKYRPPGYVPTAEEIEYIRNDTLIVAAVLKKMLEAGMTSLTVGADALLRYKDIVGAKRFRAFFPILDYETDTRIRRALRGGFVYVNPMYAGQKVFNTINLDVNSLYPDRARECLLPYGVPIRGRGKVKLNEKYPLYIQHLLCNFKLKPSKLPTVQLKNSTRFCATEYLTHAGGEPVEMSVTNVDWELMNEHYDVYNIKYLDYIQFKGAKGLFKEYIDYYYNQKCTTTDIGIRNIAKLYLNSLIGKFSSAIIRYKAEPVLIDDVIHLRRGAPELFEPVYTAVSCFVTAYARFKTISTAQALGVNNFIYSDTDSIHAKATADFSHIDIHPSRLGAWKEEAHNLWEKVLRPKAYIRYDKDGLHTTCAGLPKAARVGVTEDNFTYGTRYDGKLSQRFVRGGALLKESYFTITT